MLSTLKYLQPLIPSSDGRLEVEWLDRRDPNVIDFRDHVLEQLHRSPSRSVIQISFERAQVSASCLAEILAPAIDAIVSGKYADRFLICVDPEQLNEWDADAALEKESEMRDKKLACVWRVGQNNVNLVGKVDQQIRNTYMFVYNMYLSGQATTARDLAERDNISIQAASNRISRCVALGLIWKADAENVEGGGVQNLYEPIK